MSSEELDRVRAIERVIAKRLTQGERGIPAPALRSPPIAYPCWDARAWGVVVVLFWFLGQLAGNRGKWLQRLGLSDLAASPGRRVRRTLITGAGILNALEILAAAAVAGALLGDAGVAGIALGFAFRSIVENYLAGVLLSARNPLRRFEFQVGVSVDPDLATARDLGVATLQQLNGVLSDPGPQGLISELRDSTVQLLFLAWIDQRDSDFLKARSEAIRLVKAA